MIWLSLGLKAIISMINIFLVVLPCQTDPIHIFAWLSCIRDQWGWKRCLQAFRCRWSCKETSLHRDQGTQNLECLPDSQVYHFDHLLFTPGTSHFLWDSRKSCPQIVCSQRIEGKNGGENHEVRVVNLAGGWSMITLQNSSVTLKLKNDRLMIHDPILSFLRFNMKSYLLKSYYKKLGLKTTCRFPQWFWTRVCTTAKAFLSNFRTDPGDRQHGNGWGLLRLRGSGISQYNCFLVLETKLVCSTDPGESESPHYCGWVLLVLV